MKDQRYLLALGVLLGVDLRAETPGDYHCRPVVTSLSLPSRRRLICTEAKDNPYCSQEASNSTTRANGRGDQ